MAKEFELWVIRKPLGDLPTKEGIVTTYSLTYKMKIREKVFDFNQADLDTIFNILKPYFGKEGLDDILT